MPARRRYQDVTIANGAAVSGAADIGDECVVGIILPTITSAVITFQAAGRGTDNTPGTYQDVYDETMTEVSIGSAGSTGARFISIPPALLAGATAIKVRSGTTAAPVNQGAARTITVVTMSLS